MGSLQIPINKNNIKPHAVCIPYPAQGHINPMYKLAKLLHAKGFHISFVNTHYNHARFLRTHGDRALDGLPTFKYYAIEDGLPPTDSDSDSTQDIPSLCLSTEIQSLGPFRELIHTLNKEAEEDKEGVVPPVSCIVSDVSMFFTLDASHELGLPEVLLWTASASGFLGYLQYHKLLHLGLIPFKDANFLTNGDLDKVLDWAPAPMEGIRLRDIPSFIRTTDPNEPMVGFVQRLVHNSKRASAIVFNTFEIEQDVLEYLASYFPPIYSIGPLQILPGPIKAQYESTKTIGSNLWKEDPHCVDWLDSYPAQSVVYVNFGSITVMTNDQLIEFAWGLANSKYPFLWITRPDLVIGSSAVLPPEFLEETRDRGLIASWCNQEKVLGHSAIGGFLTHSGWNSTIESISNGVPMICWPFFAEQQTNCWYSCNKWGIGMEIDTNVKRVVVEKQVRELMSGEKGKDMKRKAMEWMALAQKATSPNGSSSNNLDLLIADVLSQN